VIVPIATIIMAQTKFLQVILLNENIRFNSKLYTRSLFGKIIKLLFLRKSRYSDENNIRKIKIEKCHLVRALEYACALFIIFFVVFERGISACSGLYTTTDDEEGLKPNDIDSPVRFTATTDSTDGGT